MGQEAGSTDGGSSADMATDWCRETAPNQELSAVLNDSETILIGWQSRPGTGMVFTSLTIRARIGLLASRTTQMGVAKRNLLARCLSEP